MDQNPADKADRAAVLHTTNSPKYGTNMTKDMIDPPTGADADLESRQSPAEGACEPACARPKSLPWVDRLLALWVFLAMLTGALLGRLAPSAAEKLRGGQGDSASLGGVSVPVAVGLLVMMYPILCQVKWEAFIEWAGRFFRRGRKSRERDASGNEKPGILWRQIVFSVVANWVIAPLLMLGLAWAFLPDKPGLRTGLIIVGLGRCIAMVLIWTSLAGGDTDYAAILVAANSMLQLVLFAPLATFFIRILGGRGDDDLNNGISYATVAASVGIFLGIPLAAAVATRLLARGGERVWDRWHAAGDERRRRRRPAGEGAAVVGEESEGPAARWFDRVFLRLISPFSLLGLLYTIIVLFAAQGAYGGGGGSGRGSVSGGELAANIARVAAPLVVYFVVAFFSALWLSRRLGFDPPLAVTQAFTAASNNFELAIAVAAASYGPESDEAMAATVGPLVEVPVLVGLVYVVRWGGKRWWK